MLSRLRNYETGLQDLVFVRGTQAARRDTRRPQAKTSAGIYCFQHFTCAQKEADDSQMVDEPLAKTSLEGEILKGLKVKTTEAFKEGISFLRAELYEKFMQHVPPVEQATDQFRM
jgi:hypothetical protein